MTTSRSTRLFLLTAALALGTTACNLDGLDGLVSDGDDDDDDDDGDGDETDGDDSGDESGDDTGNDEGGTLPSIEGGDDDPSAEGGEGPGEGGEGPGEGGEGPGEGGEGPSADETGGDPGNASPACFAYCEVELACGEYYTSIDECAAECAYTEADAGGCIGPFTALNECIGTLDCEQFATFFAALQALLEGGATPPSFPCDVELYDLANCGG